MEEKADYYDLQREIEDRRSADDDLRRQIQELRLRISDLEEQQPLNSPTT